MKLCYECKWCLCVIGRKCVKFLVVSLSRDMTLVMWLMRCSKFKSFNQSHVSCSLLCDHAPSTHGYIEFAKPSSCSCHFLRATINKQISGWPNKKIAACSKLEEIYCVVMRCIVSNLIGWICYVAKYIHNTSNSSICFSSNEMNLTHFCPVVHCGLF